MFEVGKTYRFKMWEDSDDGGIITEYAPCKVVAVEGPLIKVKDFGGQKETIVNAASLAFVSATEVTD
jgi:hypothetical protein